MVMMRKCLNMVSCIPALLFCACNYIQDTDTDVSLRASSTWHLSQIYELSWDKGVENIDLTVVIPSDVPGRQHVYGVDFSMEPANTSHANYNTYVRFSFKTKDYEGRSTVLRINTRIGTLSLTTKNAGMLKDNPDSYLRGEPLVQSDDERIRKIARPLRSDTPAQTLKRIHEYVYNHFQKIEHCSSLDAVRSLDAKAGDCSEFAVLFAAIARAAGIPTMLMYGVNTDPRLNTDGYHVWNECFVPDYGWCRIDATRPDYNYYYQSDNYIYLSRLLEDSRLEGAAFYVCRFTSSEPASVDIAMSTKVEKAE